MKSKLRMTISDIEKDLKINTLRRPLKRKCSQCGMPYFRRNLMEQWTGRNVGRRFGWHKDIAKVCLSCMTLEESKRIIGIADVQFGTLISIKKRT